MNIWLSSRSARFDSHFADVCNRGVQVGFYAVSERELSEDLELAMMAQRDDDGKASISMDVQGIWAGFPLTHQRCPTRSCAHAHVSRIRTH